MFDSKVCWLILYKQHYRDYYDCGLPKQVFSSWGYFDGFAIRTMDDLALAEPIPERLLEQIYEGSRKCIETVEGIYGVQIIGLFSYEKSQIPDKLLHPYNNVAYYGIAMTKLDNPKNYKKIVKKYNGIFRYNNAEITCECMGTFDNSDLIILMGSNSLLKIEELLRNIESEKEIIYIHTVTGVSQPYLDECHSKRKILSKWGGRDCNINEIISRFRLKISIKDRKNLELILAKNQNNLNIQNQKYYQQIFDKGELYWIHGHHSMCIEYNNIPIKFILFLLLPEGFLTHENKVFGRFLYNIESDYSYDFFMGDESRQELIAIPKKTGTMSNKKILQEDLRKAKNYLKTAENEKERFCFQNLIMMLNTLSQFELFSMSRDIYYLIVPALENFLKQFFRLKEICLTKKDWDCLAQFEEEQQEVIELVESINSIVEETIHTDQMFLMVPGYSGTSFWLSPKMTLYYQSLAYDIIDLYKENGHKYDVLLVPKLESKPLTREILLKGDKKNDTVHTIMVRFGQRMLFQPYLFIIMIHEVSHYVGEECRFRERRKKMLTEEVAFLITDTLFYHMDDLLINETDEIKQLFLKYKERVNNNIYSFFVEEVDLSKKGYASELSKILISAVWKVVNANHDDPLFIQIFGRPEEWIDEMDKIGGEVYDIYSEVNDLVMQNRIQEVFENNIERAIEILISAYKEIYSDVSAYAILEFSFPEFQRAFEVSEEVKIEDECTNKIQSIREYVMSQCMQYQGEIHRSGLEFIYVSSVEERLFSYKEIQSDLIQYSKLCLEKMTMKFTEKENQEIIEKIQRTYMLLSETTCGQNTYEELYDYVIEATCQYEENVDKWIDL